DQRHYCGWLPPVTAAGALQPAHGAQPGAECLFPIVEVGDRHEAAKRLAFRRLRMLEHGLIRHHANSTTHSCRKRSIGLRKIHEPTANGRKGARGLAACFRPIRPLAAGAAGWENKKRTLQPLWIIPTSFTAAMGKRLGCNHVRWACPGQVSGERSWQAA